MNLALFDVEKGEITPVVINSGDSELDEYYRLLRCDTIDIVTRRVEDIVFDIICDDEGLLKDKPVVSAVSTDAYPVLVGNLLFAHHNNLGETTGITQEELVLLQNHVICAVDVRKGTTQRILWGVDYN